MTVTPDFASQIQSLTPSAMIELFVVDLTAIGGSIYRFHGGTNQLTQNIVWQGNTYTPWPVQASGFDYSSTGQIPRPKLAVANQRGLITALVLETNDCLGGKVIRKRTMKRFLDAINFPGGTNPTADPDSHFADEIYFIDRKATENKNIVEFELSAGFDVAGVKLPRRQIIQNLCPWRYRGTECGYAGSDYFRADDVQVDNEALDVCGKRLSSCKARFGEESELPFGGFPGSGFVT